MKFYPRSWTIIFTLTIPKKSIALLKATVVTILIVIFLFIVVIVVKDREGAS